ncbi:MAG: CotH kinase family protein [Rikenellaceae bacterium]
MRAVDVITVALLTAITTTVSANETDLLTHWSDATHSDSVAPDFVEIFSSDKDVEDRVRRIEITISAEDWAAMNADLDQIFSAFQSPMGERPEMMGGQMGQMGERLEMMGGRPEMMGGHMGQMGERPEMMGERPEGMGMEGHEGMMDPLSNVDIDPIWVPCTVKFEGREWYKVGVRFKGNSSLMQSHQSGNRKISMKLDFDKYEKEFPELKNQRFYGFEQLNLNSNYQDASMIREKIVPDLLRDYGLVASHTSFCELYVDYGEGLKYSGLYTIVEEMDDTVIKTQFSDSSGNLYKPEERAGSFAKETFNEEQFHIKSHKKGVEPDYADVRALCEILNSELRTKNEKSWRNELESIFDVEAFLKWLAANVTYQNWDTYGNMAHNYFLYNNPSTGLLTWISWDHNESLQSGRNTYEPYTLKDAGEMWPLFTYLMAQKEYKAKFDGYLKEFIEGPFESEKLIKIVESYQKLLKESAYKEESGSTFLTSPNDFDTAFTTLKSHINSRAFLMDLYL